MKNKEKCPIHADLFNGFFPGVKILEREAGQKLN
jgi:hypothetical protein